MLSMIILVTIFATAARHSSPCRREAPCNNDVLHDQAKRGSTMEHQTKYSHNTQAHIKTSLEYSPGVTAPAHKGPESAATAKNEAK